MSKYYFIVSQLNGMVLDVDNGNTSAGTQVFTYPKNSDTNQQWYDDPSTGTIRSRLNDFCMDIADGHLVLNPYQQGKADQQWERRNSAIVNRSDSNMVLDIYENDQQPRSKVVKHPAHGGSNQSWTFESASS
jgi:hypothetical protein